MGTLSDIDFSPSQQLWQAICSEPGNCPLDQENTTARCFFQAARNQLYKADIIIANHALFCVDLAMRRDSSHTQSILPDYCGVIIDEAHLFEDSAATHMGIRISSIGIFFLLNRLYNEKSKRGILGRSGLDAARKALHTARDSANSFISNLFYWLEPQGKSPIAYENASHIPNTMAESWAILESELLKIIKDSAFDSEYRLELESVCTRLTTIRENIDRFLAMSVDECVCTGLTIVNVPDFLLCTSILFRSTSAQYLKRVYLVSNLPLFLPAQHFHTRINFLISKKGLVRISTIRSGSIHLLIIKIMSIYMCHLMTCQIQAKVKLLLRL